MSVFTLFGLVVIATPMQDHKVVFEVTSSASTVHQMVLGNIENLEKAFAPEHLSVEVVCLAGGIGMLSAKNGLIARRMASLHAKHVAFAACSNTLRGRHISVKSLVPYAIVVDSGVAEVVRKQEAGWSYLKAD